MRGCKFPAQAYTYTCYVSAHASFLPRCITPVSDGYAKWNNRPGALHFVPSTPNHAPHLIHAIFDTSIPIKRLPSCDEDSHEEKVKNGTMNTWKITSADT